MLSSLRGDGRLMSGLNSSWQVKLSLYVGLSTVALCAFFYKRAKKAKEEFDGSETCLFNYDNSMQLRHTTVELKIPANCVGTIIGPQGTRIKELQQRTLTRITFLDKKFRSKNETGDSMLQIRGFSLNVIKAELEIKKILLDAATILTEEFYVPEYAAGRIIGRGGVAIKEISSLSNCKVKLTDELPSNMSFSSSSSSISSNSKCINDLLSNELPDKKLKFKLIKFTGTFEQITSAKKLVISKIKEEDDLREKRLKKKNMSSQRNMNETTSNESFSSLPQASNVPLPLPKVVNLQNYLNQDGECDVVVSAIANPSAFWIQISHEECIGQLGQLNTEIDEFYTSQKPVSYSFNKLSELRVGQLVASKHTYSNKWYRAEVKEIINSNKIDIYYIDYGESDYATLKNLNILDEKFHKLSSQAVECNLANMDKVNEWTEESIVFFENMCHYTQQEETKKFKLKFNEFKQSRFDPLVQIAVVNLYDPNGMTDISTLLVEKGYAKSNQIECDASLNMADDPNIVSAKF